MTSGIKKQKHSNDYIDAVNVRMWARVLADILTFCRLISGIIILLWPWQKAADAFGRLIKWSVAIWTTDVLDGRLARYSNTPPSSIGANDIWVDLVMATGIGAALVRMGYLPIAVMGIWSALFILIYFIKPVSTVQLAFMLPLQAFLPVTALYYKRPEMSLYIVWILTLAVVNNKRVRFLIYMFISGLPDSTRDMIWRLLPGWVKLNRKDRDYFIAHAGRTSSVSAKYSGCQDTKSM